MSERTEEEKRLVLVAEEIEEVLKKHDVMGFVSILDGQRGHWLYFLDASWSCVSAEDGALRIRARKSDFATREMFREVKDRSLSALFGARDMTMQQLRLLYYVCQQLKDALGIEHDEVSQPTHGYTQEEIDAIKTEAAAKKTKESS